jgi:glycerol uptake facilitator-like aquaporin
MVGLSPFEGVLLEAIGTFILAISALSASSFLTSSVRQAALVGTTLFILILVIGPLAGASFNPARRLGPSMFSGYFTNQLVYWVGPLLGGVCAGLIFGALRKSRGKTRRLLTVCLC